MMLFLKFLAFILCFGIVTQTQGDVEDVDNAIWPDLSCHPGYNKDKFMEEVGSGNPYCTRGTPSPNFADMDSEETMITCRKYCSLGSMSFLQPNEEWVELVESSFLNEMFGDEYGKKLSQKVITQCNEMYRRVLYDEFHECHSEKANEVYDCIQNALKC